MTDIVTVDASGVSGHLFSMDLLVLIKRENLGKLRKRNEQVGGFFKRKIIHKTWHKHGQMHDVLDEIFRLQINFTGKFSQLVSLRIRISIL